MADLVGLVLAGGQSLRMGRDKADLILDNERLVDRATSLLKNAGCKKVLLSGAGGLDDRYPKGGPLSGIDAAVSILPDLAKILIIPVDMPNLSNTLLQVLIKKSIDTSGVYFRSQPLPFCMTISEQVRDHLHEALTKTDSDRSLFCLFQALKFTQLLPPVNSEQLFENCNTPEQFTAMGGRL
ncbi:MAG: molybdenum cofactor guanylyltransferase [Robiginitomaculum sp.]|nr:molybdenum cofactor guanylyltransferase [Robiginitomaculum sp.]